MLECKENLGYKDYMNLNCTLFVLTLKAFWKNRFPEMVLIVFKVLATVPFSFKCNFLNKTGRRNDKKRAQQKKKSFLDTGAVTKATLAWSKHAYILRRSDFYFSSPSVMGVIVIVHRVFKISYFF